MKHDAYGELCGKLAERFDMTPSAAWGYLSTKTAVERLAIAKHAAVDVKVTLKDVTRGFDNA